MGMQAAEAWYESLVSHRSVESLTGIDYYTMLHLVKVKGEEKRECILSSI